MNRKLLLTVSFSTRPIGHQTKLAEGSLKTSKRRCSSEDIIKLCKTVLLGVRNAEWFLWIQKSKCTKSRERDSRGLLSINIPPLIEKAPKQQIAGGKEL